MNEGPVQIAPLKTLNWLDQATEYGRGRRWPGSKGYTALRLRALSAISFQFGDSENRTQDKGFISKVRLQSSHSSPTAFWLDNLEENREHRMCSR